MALVPGAYPRHDRPSPCILNLRAEGFQKAQVFIRGMLLPSAQLELLGKDYTRGEGKAIGDRELPRPTAERRVRKLTVYVHSVATVRVLSESCSHKATTQAKSSL